MIEAILEIGAGAIKAWNDWRAKKRDDGLVDTGRQLQNGESLKATVKAATDAQRTREDVADLSDSDLDNELRRPASTSPGDRQPPGR